jgi:hypothetical protein
LSVLAIIGTIMNSHQAVAQGPPGGMAVRIVDPLPVPITGSTTVSGTVAATQSGLWNVGINGTPNVNVTNPATAPVLFLNVNDPGRIAFQNNLQCTTGQPACLVQLGPVPANHRLVVEHISGGLDFSSPTYAKCTATVIFSGYTTGWNPAPALLFSGSYLMNFDQPVRFYVDQNVSALLGCTTSQTLQAGSMSVTGYLLDCKAAPCAAIASF